MPRCPQCNHFVSVEPEAYLDQVDVIWEEDGEGKISPYVEGTVRLVKNCQECSEELEEAYVEFDGVLEAHTIDKDEENKHELEVTVENEEPGADIQTIGKGRGAKTYYRADIYVIVNCSCGMKIGKEFRVEEQASYFDSLN